ncbi:9195_t:CDS:2, partial [Paraglomus occultum]
FGEFPYEERSQKERRLNCDLMIPANRLSHDGPHQCKESHNCTQRCPYCEFYCKELYGHHGPHETTHGSMKPMVWVGITKTISYKKHTYRSGDSGSPVYCDMLCKDANRHLHVDYCPDETTCKASKLTKRKDQIEHINDKIEPYPKKPKDYISHRLYWSRSGFRDPYESVDEQKLFTSCVHLCGSDVHANKEKYCCTLPLFHDPVDPNTQVAN